MKGKLADSYEPEFAIHSEPDEQKPVTLASRLSRILYRFIESIIAVNELKIYSIKSRSGMTYWAIQDPITEHKIFFDSEPEVRAWLDKRYHY